MHEIFQLRMLQYEELRERMYEGEAGSQWWQAVKTELDIRNAERMAENLKSTSDHTQRLEESINQLLTVTGDMMQATKRTEKAGKRLEMATYAILLATLVQVGLVVIPLVHGH